MNAFELFEALTDIDDEQLLQADEKVPVKKPRRMWHGLIAACLALVLTMTAWLGTTAINQDTTMRYTIRYRENRVTYLCKASAYRVGEMPQYEPGWIPEDYVLDRTNLDMEQERSVTYRSTRIPQDYICLEYEQITGRYTLNLYTLPMGSYERYEVSIKGLPGQLYLYTDMRSGGELIWLDEENRMIFRIMFPEKDPTDALKMANSIELTN